MTFKVPEKCYESPCGVMRLRNVSAHTVNAVLRIPMRGYEDETAQLARMVNEVTNPHAGL